MNVEPVAEVTDGLVVLFSQATNAAMAHRGGPAMWQSILCDMGPEEFLHAAIARNELWIAQMGDNLVGLAVCRNGLIEVVYVQKSSRRQGVGTSLIRAVLMSVREPVDAYALPGDRATKSFYESLGWKARLLTMRGA